MGSRSTVLIVDDHATFGESFKSLLIQKEGMLAEAVTSIPAALAYLTQHEPHLLVMDITLQQRYEGLEFLAMVQTKWPKVKTVCLTKHNNALVCQQAYEAGASGYFTKTMPIEQTLLGMRQVLSAAEPLPQPSFKGHKHHFTPREREILAHLATGASNKELALALDMAEETAKVHMKTLLRKLGVNNRTQVAIFAYENGFWPAPMPHKQ